MRQNRKHILLWKYYLLAFHIMRLFRALETLKSYSGTEEVNRGDFCCVLLLHIQASYIHDTPQREWLHKASLTNKHHAVCSKPWTSDQYWKKNTAMYSNNFFLFNISKKPSWCCNCGALGELEGTGCRQRGDIWAQTPGPHLLLPSSSLPVSSALLIIPHVFSCSTFVLKQRCTKYWKLAPHLLKESILVEKLSM